MMAFFPGLASLVVVAVAKVACEAGDIDHACHVGTPHDHRMLQKVSRSTVSFDAQQASRSSCTTLKRNHPIWTNTRCQEHCGDANRCIAPQRVCARVCADTCPCGGMEPTPAPPADQGGAVGTISTGSFALQQDSVSRSVHINVPDGDGPFPVLILLHGNGGNGRATLSSWTRNTRFTALKESHVFVAPDGDQKSWNIINEESSFDDVEFIKLLIDHLASKSNVNANHVQLYGTSNGAALVNRILIESTDARIVRGVTSVSQLNQMQYHDGNFYVGGNDNSYTQVQPSLLRREILALQGAQDHIIPVCACKSSIGFWMNSDADSIYAYAVAYGYNGAQVTASEHPTYSSWSYLAGAVSSYTVKDARHSVIGLDEEVDNAVLKFFQRGE